MKELALGMWQKLEQVNRKQSFIIWKKRLERQKRC